MAVSDIIGYLAAALVLVAFYQRQMVPLRIAAFGSNVAFIAYGLSLGLMPEAPACRAAAAQRPPAV